MNPMTMTMPVNDGFVFDDKFEPESELVVTPERQAKVNSARNTNVTSNLNTKGRYVKHVK
jgi:hypothetical protein